MGNFFIRPRPDNNLKKQCRNLCPNNDTKQSCFDKCDELSKHTLGDLNRQMMKKNLNLKMLNNSMIELNEF